MGIDDRDWYRDKKKQDQAKDSWYDPKQFRREKPGYKGYRYEPFLDSAPHSKKRPPSLLKSIGSWLLLGLGLVLLYQYAPSIQKSWKESRGARQTPPHSVFTGKLSCQPSGLPASGSTQVADPSLMRRSDVLFSGVEIENNHRYPVVAYLTDSNTGQRVLGMSIASGKIAMTSVPVGHYGLYFFAGSVWCNDLIGFENGSRVNIQGGLDVQSGGTSILSLSSSTPIGPEKFRISVSKRLPEVPKPVQPAPEVRGQGFVDLGQRPDGHYYAPGSVNGVPMVFMLDTGATLTSISQEKASKSGIYSCAARTFNTANGKVQGCVAKVEKIEFGSFILRDFEIAVMPNLPGDALLGMNVLRLFRLEQQSGVMRISIR